MFLGFFFGIVGFALVVWSLVWKGLALWRASHKGQKEWFVLLLIVNTFGILEILYLHVFSNQEEDKFGKFVRGIIDKFRAHPAPTAHKEHPHEHHEHSN